MKKKILYLFFVIIIFILPSSLKAAEIGRIYLIEFNYDKGKVSFGEVSTKMGYAPEPERQEMMAPNRYWIEVISFKEEILERRMFSIALEIFSPPPLPGEENKESGPIILDKTKQLVILPYYKNGKTLKLYDTNMNLLGERDIGFLAQVCGDGVCQDHESFADCPEDCPPVGQDDYCNEEKFAEDPDCQIAQGTKTVQEKICNNNGQCAGEENYINCPNDCAKTKISNKIIILLVIVAIIIVIIVLAYYFLIRKKEEGGEI